MNQVLQVSYGFQKSEKSVLENLLCTRTPTKSSEKPHKSRVLERLKILGLIKPETRATRCLKSHPSHMVLKIEISYDSRKYHKSEFHSVGDGEQVHWWRETTKALWVRGQRRWRRNKGEEPHLTWRWDRRRKLQNEIDGENSVELVDQRKLAFSNRRNDLLYKQLILHGKAFRWR